jgi:hypothetical protein
MAPGKKHRFTATLELIGINPFVFLPLPVLEALVQQAPGHKGKIPVKGTVNGVPYRQTLVKYGGAWRLYINTTMLPNSPKRIGEVVKISITIDKEDRTIHPHPKLIAALQEMPAANKVFARLRPSLRNEMIKYIAHLKTEQSVDKNITRAIQFLLGKGSFVGREKPELRQTKE